MLDSIMTAIGAFNALYEQHQQILENNEACHTLRQKVLEIGRRVEGLAIDSVRPQLRLAFEEKLIEIASEINIIQDYIHRYAIPSYTKKLIKLTRPERIASKFRSYRENLTELHNELSRIIGDDAQARVAECQVRSVETIQQQLKDYYQKNIMVKLLAGEAGVPIDHLFINVMIAEKKKEKKAKDEVEVDLHVVRQRLNADQGMLSSCEDDERTKKLLEIHQIFDPKVVLDREPRRPIRRVQLLGRAGIGKTTLCRYITYRWAKGELFYDQFDWIFYFSLKEVAALFPDEAAEFSIDEVLYRVVFRKEPFHLSQEHTRQLWEDISQQPDKVMFMLDGRDEVSHLNHSVINALLEHIQCYQLTSRPHAELKEQAHAIDVTLENTGFTAENIESYIHQYFKRYEVAIVEQVAEGEEAKVETAAPEPSKADLLINWLNQHSEQKSLCHIPLMCELFCILADDEKTQYLFKQDNVLMGDVFNAVFDKLTYRYLINNQRELGLPTAGMTLAQLLSHPEAIKLREFIHHIAMEGMCFGKLIIEADLIERVRQSHQAFREDDQIIIKLKQSGFLKATGSGEGQGFFFLHLLFEEFAAGQYLIDHLDEEAMHQFIKEYKFNPTYQQVFYHAAYAAKDDVEKLNQFFDLLLLPPREISSGQVELCLLLKCAGMCGWPESLNVKSQLLEQAGKWFYFLFKGGGPWRECRSNILLSRLYFPSPEKEYALLVKTLNNDLKLQQNMTYQGSYGLLSLVQLGLTEVATVFDSIVSSAISTVIIPEDVWREVVIFVREWLVDKEGFVQERAVLAIGQLPIPDSAWQEVMALVRQGLRNQFYKVREAAVKAILQLTLPEGAWKEVMTLVHQGLVDEVEEVRKAAVNLIGQLALPESAWEEELVLVSDWLSDQSEVVRQASIQVLGQLTLPEKAWQETMVLVRNGLVDECEGVRNETFYIISRLTLSESTWQEVMALVYQRLIDEVEDVRESAVKVIGQLALPESAWEEELVLVSDWLSDQSEVVRQAAIQVIGQLTFPESAWEEGMALVRRGFADECAEVRRETFNTIRRLSLPESAWQEVITLVRNGLVDDYEGVPQSAYDVINTLTFPGGAWQDGLALVRSWLGDQNEVVRKAAIQVIGQLTLSKDAWEEGMALVRRGLTDESGEVRREAFDIIRRLSLPESAWQEVITLVRNGLVDDYEGVPQSAYDVINTLTFPGGAWQDGLALVRNWLNDQNEAVRQAAICIIRQLSFPESALQEAIALVLQGLSDATRGTQIEAKRTIGQLISRECDLQAVMNVVECLLNSENMEKQDQASYILTRTNAFSCFVSTYGNTKISSYDNKLILQRLVEDNPASIFWRYGKDIYWIWGGFEAHVSCENANFFERDLSSLCLHKVGLMSHGLHQKRCQYNAFLRDSFNKYYNDRVEKVKITVFGASKDEELAAVKFVLQCVESENFNNFYEDVFNHPGYDRHHRTLWQSQLGDLLEFFSAHPPDFDLEDPVKPLREQLEAEVYSKGCVIA